MKTRVDQWGILVRVLQYVNKHWAMIILSLMLCIISVSGTLYVPVLTGKAIDRMLSQGQVDFAGLAPLLMTIAMVVLVSVLAQWGISQCNNRIAFLTVRQLRFNAFAHLQKLPISMLDRHATGDLVSRLISDVEQFADGLLLGFSQLFSGILTILGTLVIMFRIQPFIAGVVVLLTPVSLLVAAYFARRSYALFTQQTKDRGEQTALIEEMITHQKTVRAYSQEAMVQARFDELNDRLGASSIKAIFISSITFPSTRFVNALVFAGVGIAGALVAISSGGITVGLLSSFLSYANHYTKPFNEISGVATELQNALACAHRLFELLDEKPEKPDDPHAAELEIVDGSASFMNVSFSYDEKHKLIEGLSLLASHGQRIAIVGPTGCGKTTLINLLMRFYDVNQGEIQISGHDIRQVTRRSLRRCIGMVLQDTWLKSGTIRENIAMGREEATLEEIMAAAKLTQAHRFIKRLPKGYDTVIEEDGGSLSQGQKQLLCITRVMLSLPPMLILDEATSSIDTRTELEVQTALDHLMQGRTTFVVAHRLSTIENADQILVMEKGRIVERGTHRQLMEHNGLYAKLYYSQFSG